ncbi:MAG: FAD-dependent oxidoreductase [Ruminococcaceae bacterium]|nr:FAD-dependent oxidoreductase [Oscillospiraceae bacterium]
MNICDKRPYIKKENYDVIVVGGGIAGVSAAVSASRGGASVLLIEKSILLGGLATSGLISWYEPLCDSCGKQMIGGISEELIRISIKHSFDNMHNDWKEKKEGLKDGRYTTFFSATCMSLLLDEYVLSNGVKLLFDAMVTFPLMEDNILKGIVCETKEGKVYYECKILIDATGDATVFHTAGAPTKEGDNYLSFFAQVITKEGIDDYNQNHDMRALKKWYCLGSNLFGVGHPEGMKKICGLTSEDITEFVVEGRKLLFDRIKESEKTEREVATLPTMPQFRTIRHIVGEHTFMANDREYFDNAIGSLGDFRAKFKGCHYQIPYTSLYNKNFKNMLAAGRIISAEGNGWEASRVIPVAALTGQAAGEAAAMCVKENNYVDEIDVKKLQQSLKKNGVLFEK